ncbi:MAG: winged helix-turn-helix transcriptional regulator [Firmicutes bacterium]|nr:winged helix-turn-helix transcriptional regulator [Bacillota bacterium]MCI8284739.1 winged helix-turn-helix transcriptional regulator [Bacillota bacterium]
MIYLLENEDIDTAKGISVRYGITQSLICRSVDSLTKKGYLSVAVDPNDRRVNHLTLHIEDETLLDILHGMNSSYMEYIFQGVAPEDVETFRKVLNSVIANIR